MATRSDFPVIAIGASAGALEADLESLLKAEREARGRYEQLRGYPAEEQAKALALWQEATEAVREFRSTYLARH
jgi:hypothetical protein